MATVADFGEEKVVSLTPSQRTFRTGNRPRESVVQVMRELVADMVNGVRHGGGKQSWMERAQREVQDKGPRLKTALGLSTADIVQWMHAGGPWRAFLVTAVRLSPHLLPHSRFVAAAKPAQIMAELSSHLSKWRRMPLIIP